jgi:hypothetical protein
MVVQRRYCSASNFCEFLLKEKHLKRPLKQDSGRVSEQEKFNKNNKAVCFPLGLFQEQTFSD